MNATLRRKPSVWDEADFLADAAAGLNDDGQYARAERLCLDALDFVPEHWGALANLATALHRQGRHTVAVAIYVRACRANPANAAAFSNLGVALNEMQAMELSLQAHDEALHLKPDDQKIRANRAMALLMAGHLTEGFAEFESRWSLESRGVVEGPRWRGEPLEGRRLLVWDEGGYGDTLQFVRYMRLLLDAGIKPILRVQAPLLRLVRQSFPEIETLATHEDALPEFDLQCPMIGLAHVLGTTLETVPGQIPYLTADPLQIAHWRERLEQFGPGLRVGLVWAGAPRPGMSLVHAMDGRRSMRLAQFGPLFELPGIAWCSLQLGGSEEIMRTGLPIRDMMAGMLDFADTASLVAGLDLVISVDTAVAHLAGGLGVPVLLLSRFDACWRWLAGREDTPWYEGMRVFRQQRAGNWDGPLTKVAEVLAGMTSHTPVIADL